MSDDIYFYEYSESVAASDAQLNINLHISRMVHVKDWEDLFEDKIVNTRCIITLKMAVLYMDQREYLEGTSQTSVHCIPRFPLSKTPEVFTNALLVHNLQSLKSEGFSVESQKALLSGCAYNDYFQSKADLVIYHKARCIQENTLKFVSVQSVPCPKEEIAEDATSLSFITAEIKSKDPGQMFAEALNSATQLAAMYIRSGQLQQLSRVVIYCILTCEDADSILGQISKFVLNFSESRSGVYMVDQWSPIEECLSFVIKPM